VVLHDVAGPFEELGRAFQTVGNSMALYFLIVVALGILTRMVSMAFTAGMEKAVPEMGAGGVRGAAHERYTNRALLGVHRVPTTGLRILRGVLRVLTVLMFLGYCGAVYIAFSDGSMPGQCDLCQLDPRDRSFRFWAAYSLAISLLLTMHLASMMVLVSDPPMVEATGWVDSRRMKMALRMIFKDRPAPAGSFGRTLHTACRCFAVFAIVDVLFLVACEL